MTEDSDLLTRPGRGEVRVRVLAAGVSYTDAMLRAGSYLGVPNPPFTPGYELVGDAEELGPGCTRLRVGDRVGALTVWGADAERVCVPEAGAVEVPEDLDPAEVLSLVFIYMTAQRHPPGRGGAPAADRGAASARDAREFGVEGETRPGAVAAKVPAGRMRWDTVRSTLICPAGLRWSPEPIAAGQGNRAGAGPDGRGGDPGLPPQDARRGSYRVAGGNQGIPLSI